MEHTCCVVLNYVQLFVTLWTVARQAPLSMHGFFQARIIGVGCHFLLQGIFPTQGWNLCLLHWLVGSLPLHHLRSPQLNRVNTKKLKKKKKPPTVVPNLWLSLRASLVSSLKFVTIREKRSWDSPGGPLVRTPCFHYRGTG